MAINPVARNMLALDLNGVTTYAMECVMARQEAKDRGDANLVASKSQSLKWLAEKRNAILIEVGELTDQEKDNIKQAVIWNKAKLGL